VKAVGPEEGDETKALDTFAQVAFRPADGMTAHTPSLAASVSAVHPPPALYARARSRKERGAKREAEKREAQAAGASALRTEARREAVERTHTSLPFAEPPNQPAGHGKSGKEVTEAVTETVGVGDGLTRGTWAQTGWRSSEHRSARFTYPKVALTATTAGHGLARPPEPDTHPPPTPTTALRSDWEAAGARTAPGKEAAHEVAAADQETAGRGSWRMQSWEEGMRVQRGSAQPGRSGSGEGVEEREEVGVMDGVLDDVGVRVEERDEVKVRVDVALGLPSTSQIVGTVCSQLRSFKVEEPDTSTQFSLDSPLGSFPPQKEFALAR
jgi:hypothetical protein